MMAIIQHFLCYFFIGYACSDKPPTIKLLDGNQMPVVGFGTFLANSEDTVNSVTSALEIGYRHIDTAFNYGNEKEIGIALKKWFDKRNRREDVFITAKLPAQAMRPSDISTVVDKTLKDLGLDYIDMYLIHVPFGFLKTSDFQILQYSNGSFAHDFSTDHVAIWKEMEKQVKAGKLKSIGLSNFNKTQVLKIWNNSEIKPSNLQVETNAYLQQEELLQLCRKLGIVFTAYSPLGSGATIHMRRKRETVTLPPIIKHPIVQEIAKKHNKTPAQILLRWGIQRKTIVLPKSTHASRIKENFDVFNFELTDKDMNEIKKLDQHGKYRKFDFLSFTGLEHHPEYPFADRIPK